MRVATITLSVSTLEFISSLVDALAWPLAVVIVLMLFRPTITDLMSREVRRLKAGPLEVEWERTLSEAQVELDQPGLPTPTQRRLGLAAELHDLAQRSPFAAVMEAHARMEASLRARIEAVEGQQLPRGGAAALARRAHELGLIIEETVRAVEGLSVLRNMAAHGHANEITVKQASEFVVLADAIRYLLDAGSGPDPDSNPYDPAR